MNLIIQILITLLVIVSLGLVILVPVNLANPKDWEVSKSFFAQVARIWTGLVFLIGFVSIFGA